MNEFERRLLDTVKFTTWVASFADPNRELIGVEPYVYTANEPDQVTADSLISVTGGLDIDVIMDSDSEFVTVFMSGGANIPEPAIGAPANANRVIEFTPSLLVQVTDQSSGKTFFNVPTPMPLICGAGGFPFILSSPRIIRPRSTLTVNFSTFGVMAAARFKNMTVAFHGAKLYYAGPTL